jgi:hypothetical protein
MNESPNKPRLTRRQLAAKLRELGYPIGDGTMAKLCAPAVGQGPPVAAWWGNRTLYDLDAGIAWAESRLRPATPAAA